jgi:hypothetical protein
MKTIFQILILIFIFSCSTPEYKICEFETEDKELKLYNDILTELIEQRFYHGYLINISEELGSKYSPTLDYSDTVALKKNLILAQNQLFNDTAKFETICYSQELQFGPWTHYSNDTTKELILRDLIKDVSSNWKQVAGTLASVQDKYSPQDFHLCTSKIIPFRQWKDCGIGKVSFSKLVTNDTKTKGLLYFEFNCGGNCGFGEIILVEKSKGRWTIKNTNQLWIS